VNCGGKGTTGGYTTPDLPDGRHTFEVNAVDNLGNKGTRQIVSWSTGKGYKGYICYQQHSYNNCIS
jgi:hypothetical protein